MNITRTDLTSSPAAGFVYRVTYPSLGRTLVDSVVTLGRTVLVTGVGAVVLLGAAVAIAFVVAGALGLLGYDAAARY